MRRWRHDCSVAEVVLETERLRLRRFRDDDLADWQAHLNTPEVRAHLGGVVSADDAAEKFARQRDSWNDATGGWLAIERNSDGAFLGNCGFGNISAPEAPEELRGSPEIGWGLRADCWGRGYATEAAAGLLSLMFGRFDHPIVYSQTSEANRGSWGVMTRLGMERIERLDYDDPAYPPEENPTKVYRLTRKAWDARDA
jgi:RimJ/RimL family protein N-acetyltransferase